MSIYVYVLEKRCIDLRILTYTYMIMHIRYK